MIPSQMITPAEMRAVMNQVRLYAALEACMTVYAGDGEHEEARRILVQQRLTGQQIARTIERLAAGDRLHLGDGDHCQACEKAP